MMQCNEKDVLSQSGFGMTKEEDQTCVRTLNQNKFTFYGVVATRNETEAFSIRLKSSE